MFGVLKYFARRGGLRSEDGSTRQTGIRGETFAYWFLRQQGYVLVGRNYRVPNRRGEIDLIGWDDGVLAFVEVKTRTTESAVAAEAAVDADKRAELLAMARDYLRRRRLAEVSYRFDIIALEALPGRRPQVRLHKGVFGPPATPKAKR